MNETVKKQTVEPVKPPSAPVMEQDPFYTTISLSSRHHVEVYEIRDVGVIQRDTAFVNGSDPTSTTLFLSGLRCIWDEEGDFVEYLPVGVNTMGEVPNKRPNSSEKLKTYRNNMLRQ